MPKKKKTNKELWENLPKDYWNCFMELEQSMQQVIELEHLLDTAFNNMVKLAKKRDLKILSTSKHAHEKALEVMEKITFNEDVLYAIIHYVDDLEDGIAFHKMEAADIQAALDDIKEEIKFPNVAVNEKFNYVYDFIKKYANQSTYKYIKEGGAHSDSQQSL